MSFYFRKHSQMADNSLPRNHLSDAHRWTTINLLQEQCKRGLVELNCNTLVKFKYRSGQHFPKSSKFRRLLDGKVDKVYFFIWKAFDISSHLIIVCIYVSRAVFPILMVHHFLHKSPYKMSVFERSVTCSFSRNCTQILTRTQRKSLSICFSSK